MSTPFHTPHRQLTVAQARDDLSSVVHDVAQHGPVELTEEGTAVAVIVALDEYRRLAGSRPDTWKAYERFRAETDLMTLDVNDETFANVRDRSPGRDIVL